MDLVYDFIDEQCQLLGKPPFEIPDMRFVKTALAVVDAGNRDIYMIEEMIDEAVDGKFVKYIRNGSAEPFFHGDKNIAHRAEFMAFCQHVQYSKTKSLAFVGDFQGTCVYALRRFPLTIARPSGGKHLLTDPQIITAA